MVTGVQTCALPICSYKNRDYIKGEYELRNVPPWMEDIIFDPQTSGGLLVSCTTTEAKKLIEELSQLELKSEIIGEVLQYENKYIIVE